MLAQFIVYSIIFMNLPLITLCEDHLPACDSKIYCDGSLLHTIQMSKIYQDSKTFVDMPLKYSPGDVLNNFDTMLKDTSNQPTGLDVRNFVNDNFLPPGREFQEWEPDDWVEEPKFTGKIQDAAYRKWALALNRIWKDLGRKINETVKNHPEKYSILYVPHPVIIPGGRFREFYYWDTYWIIKGLLLSEMRTTVKGMIENFILLVQQNGFVPNGGRKYYLQRSQPPLLIPMVDLLNDTEFIKNVTGDLEKEFHFWLTNRTIAITVKNETHTVARYGYDSKGPRPESYSEDVATASASGRKDKDDFYSELKAAAESGWDFSSRWFIRSGKNKGNLSNTKTRSIIPVDLNAIMCWNAKLLSKFSGIANNTLKEEFYDNLAQKWQKAIDAVLWHEEEGIWLDYDNVDSVSRKYFHLSNIAPLWTGCYDESRKGEIITKVLKYLKRQGIFKYPGGIPTTMEQTGQQWDFPNAWPPLQHMTFEGLYNSGVEEAEKVAIEIAEKWLESNYEAWVESDAMFEKYDAETKGSHGKGGEYETPVGFGWTNGVIMDFLYKLKTVENVTETASRACCLCSFRLVFLLISRIVLV